MIQNLAWAAGYNIAAIPLAAGALAVGGIHSATRVGAVLMSLSTIVVAVNAQFAARPRAATDKRGDHWCSAAYKFWRAVRGRAETFRRPCGGPRGRRHRVDENLVRNHHLIE
jgi:hypothetical protein